MRTLFLPLFVILTMLLACGKDTSGPQEPADMSPAVAREDMRAPDDMTQRVDMRAPEDMRPEEDMRALEDMTQRVDMASATPDMRQGAGLLQVCEGECAQQTLRASFGETVAPFGRAYYGLSAPQTTTSGEWELFIEAMDGGVAGCPTQDSPPPARTLIVSKLRIPTSTQVLTSAQDELSSTLLDYEGSLLEDSVFESASTVRVEPVAIKVCVECVGKAAPSHEEGFVALDVAVGFAGGGEVSGRLYATHCDSMDVSAP